MSAPTVVQVRYSVSHSSLLTRKNAARIRALAPTVDRSHVGPYSLANYKCEYRLHFWPGKGWHWVEVYYASGMCGFHRTLRGAVIAAARLGNRIQIEAEELPCRPPSPYFDRDFLAQGMEPPRFKRADGPQPVATEGNR